MECIIGYDPTDVAILIGVILSSFVAGLCFFALLDRLWSFSAASQIQEQELVLERERLHATLHVVENRKPRLTDLIELYQALEEDDPAKELCQQMINNYEHVCACHPTQPPTPRTSIRRERPVGPV